MGAGVYGSGQEFILKKEQLGWDMDYKIFR
jgi:hypothetical protein